MAALTKEKMLYFVNDFAAALLRLFPPEFAHHIALYALKHRILSGYGKTLVGNSLRSDIDLTTFVPGLGTLPHPIGMAAGFDKDGICFPGLFDLGFSFVEVGTVTPYPQIGQKKPRLFRVKGQRGIINRMGFNNCGQAAMTRHLNQNQRSMSHVLGVNVGKNKNSLEANAVSDYSDLLNHFSPLCDYLVVNISSPNTEGLRSLSHPEFINALKANIPDLVRRKTWIKLDPDLPKREFQKMIEAICEESFAGVILTNTHKVNLPEAGGLSGHPLLLLSTLRLEWAYEVHRGQLPMIGSGGILSGLDILEKVLRGACAVEIYTSLIYRGPYSVSLLLLELAWELKLRGYRSLAQAQFSFYDSH